MLNVRLTRLTDILALILANSKKLLASTIVSLSLNPAETGGLELDRIPIFGIRITPPIASRVISRTPIYRNPPAYLKLCSEGKWRESHQKVALYKPPL